MEFFRDAYSVRLLGHKGKYLWAHDDRKSVAQKRGQDSYGVIWRVELVPDRNAIRLKSVYDLYLMASDYAFLLGATGKKVMQSFASKADSSLEWDPVAAGTFVKLKTKSDKFLRANGGVPPYRNSVTHDVPVLASNQHVVLWEVEVVRKIDDKSFPPSRLPSPRPSYAAQPKSPPPPPPPRQPQVESSDDDDEIALPIPANVPKPPPRSIPAATKIEIPPTAEYSSSPSEFASPVASPPPPRRRAPPPREPSESPPLSRRAPPPREASESPPPRRRSSPPFEPAKPPPIRRRGSPPRGAYENPPPRRRASPSREPDESPPPRRRAPPPSESFKNAAKEPDYDSSASEPSSPTGLHPLAPHRRPSLPAHDDYDSSPSRARAHHNNHDDMATPSSRPEKAKSPNIRRIFYNVAEDDGEVLAHDDETFGNFMFSGHTLQELTEELQRVTRIDDDIILCMRNPLSAKLYKMRLALPPNKAPLSIVIVRSNSQFGRTLSTSQSTRLR